MKKILLTFSVLTFSISSFAQEVPKELKEETGNNEIRINLFNSLFGSVDFQYERLFKDNSGFGVTVGIGYDNDDMEVFNTIFNLTPAYRLYFSKKKAAGFFIEGSTRFSYDKGYKYYYSAREEDNQANVGLGLALGGKVLSKKGLVGSFKGGLGRFVTENYPIDVPVYLNFEVSIGKRF